MQPKGPATNITAIALIAIGVSTACLGEAWGRCFDHPASDERTDVFVPAAWPGDDGEISHRRISICISNVDTATANVQFFFLRLNQTNPTPAVYNDTLAPGKMRIYDNAAELMFGEAKAGVVRVISDRRLVVRSQLELVELQATGSRLPAPDFRLPTSDLGPRTSDSGFPTSDLGLFFAAVPANFAISAGQKTELLGLYGSDPLPALRTSEKGLTTKNQQVWTSDPGSGTRNEPIASDLRSFWLGLVETNDNTVSVKVSAFDETGNALASKDYALAAFEPRLYNPGDFLPGAITGKVKLEVEVLSGSGKVIAFGSGLSRDAAATEKGHTGTQDQAASDSEMRASKPADKMPGPQMSSLPEKAAQGGSVTGSGTAGQLTMWTDGKTLGSSALAQDGSGKLGVGGFGEKTRLVVDEIALDTAIAGRDDRGIGVHGLSQEGTGVVGFSGGGGTGVRGHSESATGVLGESNSGPAVMGASNSGRGVFGKATSGVGIFGDSMTGRGVEGHSKTLSGVVGTSDELHGVAGESKMTFGALGRALEGAIAGVHGRGVGGNADGVQGQAEGSGRGVYGKSTSGDAVFGEAESGVGVHGKGGGSADGVFGESASGAALHGKSSGSADGVFGESVSGAGVKGMSTSRRGVLGISQSNIGVEGRSETSRGMQGVSVGEIGVAGFSTSGFGVQGLSMSSTGVHGESTTGRGVEGVSDSRSGLFGMSNSSAGVAGISTSGDGVFGMASDASGTAAGRFSGRLIAAIKLFQIDHPLDPANKYLNHVSVESPEMKNFYDGVARLNDNGEAVVTLPEWFEALNKEFRYQLTAIGAPGPNLHIAEKLANNRFKIGGGSPGIEVSWLVTGIRQDVWAKANPVVVEQAKPERERGTYLNPELFGQPEEKSFMWVHHPDLMEQLKRMKEGKTGSAAPSTRLPL